MASSYISKPGTEYGPCIGDCDHRDCSASRKIASANCHWCNKPIGYDTHFYSDGDGVWVHAVCEEEAEERRQAAKGGAIANAERGAE